MPHGARICNFAEFTTPTQSSIAESSMDMNDTYTVEDFRHDISVGAGQRTNVGQHHKYFILSDGALLSYESAVEERAQIESAIVEGMDMGCPQEVAQWLVIGCEANFDDQDLKCCHSNEVIKWGKIEVTK